MPQPNRQFHYVVRSKSPGYEFVSGYGSFLDSITQQINTEMPDSAEKLINGIATGMYAPAEHTGRLCDTPRDAIKGPRDGRKWVDALPVELRDGEVDPTDSNFFGPIPATGAVPYGYPMESNIREMTEDGRNLGIISIGYRIHKMCENIQNATPEQQADLLKAINNVLEFNPPLTMDDINRPVEDFDKTLATHDIFVGTQAELKLYVAIADKYLPTPDAAPIMKLPGEQMRTRKPQPWDYTHDVVWNRFSHEIEMSTPDYDKLHPAFSQSAVILRGNYIVTRILACDNDGVPTRNQKKTRGYYNALLRNQGSDTVDFDENYFHQFAYTAPDGSSLPLMTICAMKQSKELLKKHFTCSDPEVFAEYMLRLQTGLPYIKTESTMPEDGTHDALIERFFRIGTYQANTIRPDDLYFMHPVTDETYMRRLEACIDPLMQRIDSDETKLDEKVDAMSEAYWLLAQTTPVVRGGSAFARIALEHFSHRIREKGHDYFVPYTREDIDLWAEAVTTELDVFKERFRDGVYFDREISDEKVLYDLCAPQLEVDGISFLNLMPSNPFQRRE